MAAPPRSRYGHVDGPFREANLVPPAQESTGFPPIPGVAYTGLVNYLHVTDYTTLPPTEGPEYAVRVPEVDIDGNSIAGIRLHSHTALAYGSPHDRMRVRELREKTY